MRHLAEYDWTLLSLPDRYFRWRIRGNPLSWLQEPALQKSYDLVIATSMVDVATIKGLYANLANTPWLLYFHENQFAFPQSQQQHSSVDPQMVNLYSALAADRLLFNSQWNRQSFLQGVQQLIQKLPDHIPHQVEGGIGGKSKVLPVPIADDFVVNAKPILEPVKLVWAARWEYDKGPQRLLAAIQELEAGGIDYRLSIIGPQYRKVPKAFAKIKEHFSHRLEHFGYQASRQAYLQVLQSSHIYISTAEHEFQGLAALEAVACGCLPLLPQRLSYPEIFGEQYCYASDLDDAEREAQSLVQGLHQYLVRPPKLPDVSGYQWQQLSAAYQQVMEPLLALSESSGSQPDSV